MTRRRHSIGLKQSMLLVFVLFFGTAARGQTNYSLSFDGVNDYVTIPKSGTLNLEGASEFTIQVYINNDVLPGSPTWRYLISNTGTTSSGSFNTYGGYLLKYGADGGAGPYDYQFNFQTTSTNGVNTSEVMAYETWQDLSIVYNGSTLEYYYDGVSVGSYSITGNFDDYDGDLIIGKGTDGNMGNIYFPGKFDDLRIWNIALTQSQIQSYVTTSPTGNESGLVGYWNFNEGSGTTLTDLTSNGNDGTISGATWSTDVPITSLDDLYPFDVVDPTGLPYHIIVSGLTVNGENPSSGTEIGIFDGNLCVGAGNYDPSSSIVVWEGSTDPPLSGFTAGDSIRVLVRTSIYNNWSLYEPVINVVTGDGNFGSGSYTVMDLSVTSTLEPDISTSSATLDLGALLVH